MADNVKGEVPFEADGTTYTLVYSINAIINLEGKTEKTIQEIGEAMQDNPRLAFLRTVFHAGLLEHHRDVTEEQAGEVMQKAGGLAKAGALISEAFTAAFGAPEGDKGADPQKAAQKA